MILNEEKYTLNGKEIVLRSAHEDEAEMLVSYLKTVTGQTRFLMKEPDEIHLTVDMEKEFIRGYNESDDSLFMLSFVDGKHAGTCSFKSLAGSRRAKHRAGVGIALYLEYTNFGLGRLMLERILQTVKEQGFEQAELSVHSENARARHLYESVGFKECGRIPNASKYDDGTYSDDILMVLTFKGAENNE